MFWKLEYQEIKITKLDGTSLFLDGFAGSSSRALWTTFRVLWGGKFDRDATGALIR
jgi:hypothetical protein